MKKLLTLISILLLLTACGEKDIMAGHDGFDKKDHHFVTKSQEAIMDDIEARVPGVYYFGFANCPVCTDLVPVFEDVLTDLDVQAIYIDVSKDEFQKIAERFQTLDQSLPQSMQSGGGVPFVLVVDEDENIRTHAGTVNSYTPGAEEMDENEIEYLKVKLTQAITGQ